MKELNEIRFDDTTLVLKDNLVRSPILPKGQAELDRDIQILGKTIIEGAVYARNLEITAGPLQINGPVFTQGEIHVVNDFKGHVVFRKSVGSAGGLVSHAPGARMFFGADVNARQINLRNAYVAASVFGDEVTLENCVVLGGVFATNNLSLNNAVVGTYNSPSVCLSQNLFLLLPSAFSVEPVSCLPGTTIRNIALADLGALMRGVAQNEFSGYILIDPVTEEQRVVLTDPKGNMQVVRSLSVGGKVLATDLLDMDKLQNHFIMAAGSLGSQLLKSYSLPGDSPNGQVELTMGRISQFFFNILNEKLQIRPMQGDFDLKKLMS